MKPAAEFSVATMLLAALMALAGPVAVAPFATSAQAAEAVAFTIPAEEGYGIADCMQPGRACGAAIADSWCEAHGHRKSLAYGLASDVTGAIPAQAVGLAPGDVLIRCGD